MNIRSCYIENFGKLHEFKYEFNKGINIINEKNGWGKSTLATFIKVMFYGFDNTNKRAIEENERKKYYPWQGGKYGGNLEFEINGKIYEIERFFGSKDKDDTFKLYDKTTNMESNEYSENLGEEIFKINREAYERSTYIPQQAISVKMNDSLNAKLSNILEGENDINSSEEAIDKIVLEMKEYKKTGNRGKINELESQILNKKRQLEQANKNEELINERNKKIENTKIKIIELENEKDKSQNIINNYFMFNTKLENLNNEIKILNEKLQSEEKIEKLEEKNKKQKNSIKIFLSVLIILISIILGRFVFKYLYLLIIIGVFLLLYTFVKNNKKTKSNETKNTQKLINEKNDELHSIKSNMDSFLGDYQKLDLIKNKNQLVSQELNNLINQKSYDENELNRLINTLDTVEETEIEIEDLENELADLKYKYNILDKTSKYLQKSKEEFSTHYLKSMTDGFEKYVKILNSENLDTNIDINLNVKIKANGENKELNYFSIGYQDLIQLCIRFALIDALFEKERPFIILDDPFVNLDEDKIKKAKQILQEFSKKYQIIYFICHDSRK